MAFCCLPARGGAREHTAGVGDASQLLECVVELYTPADNYRLDFEQELYWALADSSRTVRGVAVIERPSRLSVRYEDGGRIVAVEDSLWVYVPSTNQFFAAEVDTSDVVIDPTRLLRQYVPSPSEPMIEDGESGALTVRLRPRRAGAEPAKLLVRVDAGSCLLTEIAAYATGGDQTTYRILGTEFNVSLPDSEFSLRCPPGAERICGSPLTH